MTDAIQKAREALVAARDTLSAASRQLTDDHKIVLGGKRWGETAIAKIGAALAALDAETPATPADVGQEPAAWRWKAKDAEIWVYDPADEWLRMQSDDEIDREPLYSATALERVTRERDEALKGRDDWKDMFEQAKQKHGYCIVRGNELTDKLSAAEAKLAEALADRAAQAERIRELEKALRSAFCPRPCDGRPDDFEVGQCVDADECGCCVGHPLLTAEMLAARAALGGNADA